MKRFILACAGVVALVVSCSSPAIAPPPTPVPVTLPEISTPESVDPYRAAGFVVASGSIPFVGIVRFAATEYVDSTNVVLALSIPPRALSFVRAGDRYAAYYAMKIDVMKGDAIVRSERPAGEVRVASFSETTRGDEGVVFQRAMRLAPGAYSLRVTAHDSLGTGNGTADQRLLVPTLSDGTVSPLLPVFAAAPRRARSGPLMIVANPRATARYGRDSVLRFYLEAYGDRTPDTVVVSARRDSPASVLVADTIIVPPNTPVRPIESSLPVSMLGLGPIRIVASAGDREIDAITANVTLGIDLPVATVDELIEALRYFIGDAELIRFRSASVANRPAQWAAMVRRTDPNPATPDNEALLEYARRLRVAARLFRSPNNPGWRGDRGAVMAALGEPDVMGGPQVADSLGSIRVISWEYRRHRLQLHFMESNEIGGWRLTPLSDADFHTLLALSGPCVGCR